MFSFCFAVTRNSVIDRNIVVDDLDSKIIFAEDVNVGSIALRASNAPKFTTSLYACEVHDQFSSTVITRQRRHQQVRQDKKFVMRITSDKGKLPVSPGRF